MWNDKNIKRMEKGTVLFSILIDLKENADKLMSVFFG